MTTNERSEIRTFINDREVPPSAVDQWEARRARTVIKKYHSRLGGRSFNELLDGRSVSELLAAPLDEQRASLVTMKERLGHAGVYALFRRDLAVSEVSARIAATSSRGGRGYSVTRLVAPGRSADQFALWFNQLTTLNRETQMLEACPDHHLLRGLADGRQEVVEATGGSPAVSRFICDYSLTDELTTAPDPNYPIQIAGQAMLDDGTCIGGVRHQLRDVDGALEVLCTVEFPSVMPSRMLSEHQWHLAAEFGNWIRVGALPLESMR